MLDDVFGEIAYREEEQGWIGSCRLPELAEYGRVTDTETILSDPDPQFLEGSFSLKIRDDSGKGPTPKQRRTMQYVREHEHDVCLAVVWKLVDACGMKGGFIGWLAQRRNSRVWGWLAQAVGPEYKSPEDMKTAVRCTELELAVLSLGEFAYIAFYFETMWGIEMEHGLSVVYHPQKGASCGDASLIDYLEDVDTPE